jgi:hypothetical protein
MPASFVQKPILRIENLLSQFDEWQHLGYTTSFSLSAGAAPRQGVQR